MLGAHAKTRSQLSLTPTATTLLDWRVAYQSARDFKYAGRTLLVVGVALDVYSVVKADKPLRQAAKVASGWAGAWLGCKVVGAGGAWVGTAVTPGIGTAFGGVAGCLVGGFVGYEGASRAAGRLYDWGEAEFASLPERRHRDRKSGRQWRGTLGATR